MLCVIVVNAWRLFPFAIVIFLAGITAVPQDVIDAATVDGAGFWRRNYQIILPMILPIVADRPDFRHRVHLHRSFRSSTC